MKRFYSTATLLILFCVATFAQELQQEIYPKQKIKDTFWKTQRPRHEFQFGIGDHSMSTNGYFNNDYYSYLFDERDINWFDPDVYLKTRIYTPAFSATYHYRLLKWLSVGGYVSYAGVFTKRTNIITEEDIFYKDHFFAIAPSVRFTYLNRKYITLYSGLAVGMMWEFSVDDLDRTTWSYVNGQLTAFGISAGKKWFGFTELGYGSKGIITAGFGYRFNSK